MTSRELTGLLTLPEPRPIRSKAGSRSDLAYRLMFGAIGWPWLLYSLWGGTKASKAHLLHRLDLDADALPHLGSWKADTGFLHRIVDAIEELRPRTVVELGAGASTLVCAKALELNGGGQLVSYDQHAAFVEATSGWLADHGVEADLRYAPLDRDVPGWPGVWYDLADLPESIDLLIIDGPPWSVHPFVRGAAETLFARLSPGAIVLLDDANRPGERLVARRWRRTWPDVDFQRAGGSTKGTLIGRKDGGTARPARLAANDRFPARAPRLGRVAAMLALVAGGWIARDVTGGVNPPASAASIVDRASASYVANLAYHRMRSQGGSTLFDPGEIRRLTGIDLPTLPAGWRIADVQIFPAEQDMAVSVVVVTERGEMVSLFATRAETPAERIPLLARRQRRAVAFWEEGPFAYAVTAELDSQRVLDLAAAVVKAGSATGNLS